MSGDQPEARDKSEKQQIEHDPVRQIKRPEIPGIDKPLSDKLGQPTGSIDRENSSDIDKPLSISQHTYKEQGRAQAREEWNNFPSHYYFDYSRNGHDPDEKRFENYVKSRDLYAKKGIFNVAEFIQKNIIDNQDVKFLEHNIIGGGTKDLLNALKTAEKSLASERNLKSEIKTISGFVPRSERGTTRKISEHGLGHAIDINAYTNAFIANKDEMDVIKNITGVDLGESLSTDRMREASKKFMDETKNDTDEVYLKALKGSLTALRNMPDISGINMEIKAKQKAIENLRRYAKNGFFNLSQTVIDALTDEKGANLKWGGTFIGKKDFMHFELR